MKLFKNFLTRFPEQRRRRYAIVLCIALLLTINIAAVSPAFFVAEAANTTLVTVTDGTAVVRGGAGIGYTSVATVYQNSTYRFLGEAAAEDGGTWYKIMLQNARSGWIYSGSSAKLFIAADDVYSDNSHLMRYVVPAGTVVLRATPSKSAAAVATVNGTGAYVAIDDAAGSDGYSWFKVQYGGTFGWVSRLNVNIYNNYRAIPEKTYTAGDKPVIYLSPSNQTANPYKVGNTNEHLQMQRVAVALKAVLEERYDCTVFIADRSTPIGKTGRPLEAKNMGADLYLALHSNASGSAGTGCGAQGYYFAGSATSQRLADNLVRSMGNISPFGSTVTQLINGMNYLSGYGYGEVRNPGALGIPTLLFELEFHDRADTAAWIINNTELIASAIADGIQATYNLPAKGSADSVTTTASTTATTAPVVTEVTTTATEAAPSTTTTTRVFNDGNAQASTLLGMTAEQFIEAIGPLCTDDMDTTGIPASITIAQAILESGYGQSELAQNANSLFGMKKTLSSGDWSGEVYTKETQEERDGQLITITAEFRKYASLEQSILDHSSYITTATFTDGTLRYTGITDTESYVVAAQILADGHYATDSGYADKLCELVRRYDLTRYDTTTQTTIATTTTTTTAAPIPQSLSISAQSLNLHSGESVQLYASVIPLECPQNITWASANPAIAEVSPTGYVTAKGYGVTVLTAVSGSFSAQCVVDVTPDISLELLGASIRITQPYGIRFGFTLGKDEAYKSTDIVEYGTIMIPADRLGSQELTVHTPDVLKIKANRLLSEDSTSMTYTGVLTDIPTSYFSTVITGRGYVIYRDVCGDERVIYSDSCSESFDSVALYAYDYYSRNNDGSAECQDILNTLNSIINA